MTEEQKELKDNTGYVYILTNPSFSDDWIKIGKSQRPVDIRSKELDNTAVPLPFEIYATIKTKKYDEVEKFMHKTIDRLSNCRIRQNREFFNIAPEDALGMFKDIAKVTDNAVIDECWKNKSTDETNEPQEENHLQAKRRDRFKFSMIGLKTGDTIRFDALGTDVTIVSEDKVEYKDRIYRLSPFVREFLPENQRNDSGSYQGSKYFSYNGKTLEDLRKEMEEEASTEE